MDNLINTLSVYYRRIRYFAGIFLGEVPFLYRIFYAGVNKNLMISKDKEIVIEGYPRSANSFCHIAFKQSQKRNVKTAHHVHAPAQVLLGLKYKIPVIVLIREPADAIKSHLIRNKSLTPWLAALGYYRFYKSLLHRSTEFVIAPFSVVTKRPDLIIDRVNKKYNTDFCKPDVSDENLKEIIMRVKSAGDKLSEDHIFELPVPSNKREVLKNEIVLNTQSYLYKKCSTLFEKYIDIYSL
jgi:hypothetical protein